MTNNGKVTTKKRVFKKKKGETEDQFTARKARAQAEAAEQTRRLREEEHERRHPSDTPLEKFARVWDSKYEAEQVFIRGDGGYG